MEKRQIETRAKGIKLNIKKYKVILTGVLSYLPIISRYIGRHRLDSTASARYCYTVWMRHLIMAHKNNLSINPKIVAELGPGPSIGMGLAALISGAEKYYAFDVKKYANIEHNIKIFDDLVTLFKEKANLPDSNEYPKVKPCLDNYDFPTNLLTAEQLKSSLANERLEKIKYSILNPEADDSVIKYVAPWDNTDLIEKNTVDMIFSQAVLEHVDEIDNIYKIQFEWLKQNGIISHIIDFKCHGTHKEWNGHWTYSNFTWNIIRGNKPYLLNRTPHSRHISLIENSGLELVYDKKYHTDSKLNKKHFVKKFKDLTDEDMTISEGFIQAIKPL